MKKLNEIIKEKEDLMNKVYENTELFKTEMIKTLNERTSLEFEVEVVDQEEEPLMIFKADTEYGYVYFIVDFEEYGVIDIDDYSDGKVYHDILWELKEELEG